MAPQYQSFLKFLGKHLWCELQCYVTIWFTSYGKEADLITCQTGSNKRENLQSTSLDLCYGSEVITWLKHIWRYHPYSHFELDVSKKQKQTKIAITRGCFDTRSLKITSRCVRSVLIRTCPSVNKLGTFNLTGIQVSCILSTIKFWFFCETTLIYWEYGKYHRAHGFFNEENLLRKWSTLVSGRWYTQYSHTFLKFR